MRFRLVALNFLLIVCLPMNLPGAPAQRQPVARPIVIEGATLIDGTGKPPIPRAVIIINGDRIATVGTEGSVRYPQGAEVIRAQGQYVIPGLFESHTHYPEWAGELFLAYGITSVTDLGNSTEWIAALKKLFAKGDVKMPRIFSTGEFLGAPPNVSRGLRGDGSENPYMTYVADVDQARSAARHVIDMGMDALKLWQNLSPDQIRAIVSEAQTAHLPVTGHAFNAEEAAELGYNRIEHTHGLHNAAILDPEKRRAYAEGRAFSASLLETKYFDHIIQTLVSRGVYYDPLLVYEYKALSKHSKEFYEEARALMSNPALRYIPAPDRQAMVEMYTTVRETGLGVFMGPISKAPPERLAEYQQGYRKDQEFVRRFAQAGGKLCAGTDSPGLIPGLSVHQEMEMLAEAGVPPMEVLLSATRYPAEFLRKSDQLGTVEPGKLADMVILDANPLEDISNTQKIRYVLLGGKLVDTRFHPNYHLPFARPRPYQGGGQGFFSVPTLTNLAPRGSTPGKAVELTVQGAGFTYASEIWIEGHPLPTKFSGPSRLQSTIPADLLKVEKTYFVTVRNPSPGGGESTAYGFVVVQK